MDLNSLLNSQKESNLALSDLQQLLAKRDSQSTLDKIQTATAYIYPNDKQETFRFFDTFIQLILSIVQDEDPYNLQYTKSIIIDSLRKCINGLLRQHGIGWLIEFPSYFSALTWQGLHTNNTILVYLYGLVLALMKKPELIQSSDWIQGILQFMQSDATAVIVHLWLNVCYLTEEEELDDFGDMMMKNKKASKDLFLEALEHGLLHKKVSTQKMFEMFVVLKDVNIEFLNSQVDQELGNALARPPFGKDELMLGYIRLENECQSKSDRYLSISKIYHQFINKSAPTSTNTTSNPLLSYELTSSIPSDKYAQTEAIRQGTLHWIKKMSTITPPVFDLHLKELIQKHYPSDRKTVLDLVLADWALRDRFHRHLNFITDTFITQLQSTMYNRRSSPYYAFVQLFNIPDEHHQNQLSIGQHGESDNQTYDQMKSGAYIDLSQFSNCSDIVLMNGCFLLLQRMTLNGSGNSKVEEWMSDCLQSATPDIIKRYTRWLCVGLANELESKKNKASCYSQSIKVLLKSCVAQSSHIVPTLLDTFCESSLSWLLKQNTSYAVILLHYFDDGPQVSKDIVVTRFFTTKTKDCVDLLLGYLREQMSGTDPKAPRSRAWFKNHFLCNILSLVGDDQDGKSVASCIFRQLFKTRDDFEWYFSTPLVPAQPILFKSLALANAHDIYAVKNTGLAAMFQELVRLNDGTKKERLLSIWFDLWTSPVNPKEYRFTVPVSWILQCAGLYDQAPVLVKQMIKRFMKIGMQQHIEQQHDIMRLAPERKFLDRMMDLVLLSDTPEPDNLFELVLNVTCDYNDAFEEINSAIINIMIELSEELELEILASSSTLATQPPKKLRRLNGRHQKKQSKMSRIKLGALMRKHEEELEKYFKDLNESTTKINNAIKALTTLAQRVFSFLLRLLNNTSSLSTIDSTNQFLFIRQEIQQQLVNIPLYYEPLAKLAKLITQPEDLHEDIQTAIELSVEYLKKQPDKTLFEASQKILNF